MLTVHNGARHFSEVEINIRLVGEAANANGHVFGRLDHIVGGVEDALRAGNKAGGMGGDQVNSSRMPRGAANRPANRGARPPHTTLFHSSHCTPAAPLMPTLSRGQR